MAGHLSPEMDIGIAPAQRKAIAEGLCALLADTYTLYLKSHNFHWNVTGPMFETLHIMFERHYNELWIAVDVIAERIRALGFPSPGTYADFARLSSVKEQRGVPEAREMIRSLVDGHEAVARTARKLVPAADRGVANERALPGFPDRSGHRERCTGYDARARFCCSSR